MFFFQAGRGSRVESISAHCAGGLPIEYRHPTSVTNVACRERDRPPCCIHTYTVYTPIGGKGRCRTRRDLQDHSMQARKSAGKISTLDLKPMRKDTRSPKQEQSVAPQNGPWSRQKFSLNERNLMIFYNPVVLVSFVVKGIALKFMSLLPNSKKICCVFISVKCRRINALERGKFDPKLCSLQKI